MFFFIGGLQPRTVTLDKQPLPCPTCSHSRLILKRTDSYLSLFFIPLVPLKKGTPYFTCENCQGSFPRETSEPPAAESDFPHSRAGQCPRCGRRMQEDFRLCPYCGERL